MGKIHLLEDELINKIAAGEVIDRPASVLKELVENAIDAGALSLRIELEEGGCRRLTVQDDGAGILADDLPLAVRRHATSKISCQDDLFAIDTMGFRGEALASVAAVSRFSLASRPGDAGDQGGRRLVIDEGGEKLTPWSGPTGTTVSVQDLFYNIPARRRFLKKAATEYAHCLELVQSYALCLPEVGFTLIHNGREQLRVPALPVHDHEYRKGEEQLRHRAAAVLGEADTDGLVYVTAEDKLGCVEALVSPPGKDKGSSRYLRTWVNGRWVKDKTLRYGILRGYHSHLLKGRFPVVLLFLSIEPGLVDVNVHPGKTELRFQYGAELQNLIAVAIRRSIRAGAWAAPAADGPAPEIPKAPAAPAALIPPSSPAPAPSLAAGRSSSGPVSGGGIRVRRERFPAAAPLAATPARPARAAAFDEFALRPPAAPAEPAPAPFSGEGREVVPWEELEYLGSFAACYLMFQTRGGKDQRLLVLDQHAFHERILYERLVQDREQHCRSQPLLMPEGLDLDPPALEALLSREEELREHGFVLQRLSAGTLEVRAVPLLLVQRPWEAMLEQLAGDQGAGDVAGLKHDLLSTMACHAAVRAGENLSPDELKILLQEAITVDFWMNCPHGRPVLRWWSKAQVGAWFDR